MQENEILSLMRDRAAALEEIDRILHQMLLLAELSASGANVDRLTLQREVEYLQKKIDRVADRMESPPVP